MIEQFQGIHVLGNGFPKDTIHLDCWVGPWQSQCLVFIACKAWKRVFLQGNLGTPCLFDVGRGVEGFGCDFLLAYVFAPVGILLFLYWWLGRPEAAPTWLVHLVGSSP